MTCSSCKPMTDAVAMCCGLASAISTLTTCLRPMAEGGARKRGGGARQHVEWHEMELTPPPPPLRAVVP